MHCAAWLCAGPAVSACGRAARASSAPRLLPAPRPAASLFLLLHSAPSPPRLHPTRPAALSNQDQDDRTRGSGGLRAPCHCDGGGGRQRTSAKRPAAASAILHGKPRVGEQLGSGRAQPLLHREAAANQRTRAFAHRRHAPLLTTLLARPRCRLLRTQQAATLSTFCTFAQQQEDAPAACPPPPRPLRARPGRPTRRARSSAPAPSPTAP